MEPRHFELLKSLFLSFILFTIIVAGGANSALAADGDLDPTFGGTGKFTTALPYSFDFGSTVVVQPDGKTLVAGIVSNINFEPVFGVVRYNVDGSLDPTFGTNGVVMIDIFDYFNWKLKVVLQNDGKIILGGTVAPLGVNGDFGLVRLNPNGTLDASFGIGGTFTCDFFGFTDGINSVAVQADGKIVAAGFSIDAATGFDFAIVRVSANGTLDPTFGVGGKKNIDFFNSSDIASGVGIQQDGKIVAAGSSWYDGTLDVDFSVLRLNSDGTLDNTFGTGGKATASFSTHDEGNAMAIQSDGKIVVGGSAGADSILTADFGLARFNVDGSLDQTFGTNGTTTTDFFSALDHVNDLIIQPDGKIVAVGDINPNTINIELYVDFGLARYNSNGVLDPSFGNGGKVVTDFGHADYGVGIAMTPDCKIVASGYSWDLQTGGDIDFAVARYNSSGCTVQPPPTGTKCTRTHGYWKTHPEAWPVTTLVLGSQTYTKSELLSLLGTTSQTDASVTLARQLIAAKLNVANGSDATPIASTIAEADALLAQFSGKLPYKVKPSSTIGQSMVAASVPLTDYNSGLMTPVCTP